MRSAVLLLSVVHAGALRLARVARAPAPRCCASEPPKDLDTVCEEARTCLREALLQGKRGLTVETSMGSLDVTSRMYDPPVFARFALEVSRALTVLDGPLLILLPGMAAVTEALEMLDGGGVWPEEDRERLTITSLGMQGAPRDDIAPPTAVVLVGLAPPADSDDSSLRDAREWMSSSAVTICINAQLERKPVEMASFEPAYCLMTYTISRTDTQREDANLYQEDAGSAALYRRYPGEWRVLLDSGNAKEWEVAYRMEERPSSAILKELILPRFERRQAAIDSAQSALGDLGASGARTPDPARAGAGGGGTPVASGAGGGGDEGVSDGVVSFRYEETERAGLFGPTALYGALVLLRIRVLSDEACLENTADEGGVHLLVPEVAADAATLTDPAYKKMRGAVVAGCHLVPDAAAPGIARLQQLAVQASAPRKQVEAMLRRALSEAQAAGQSAVVVEALAALEGSQAESCLLELGFRPSSEGLPQALDVAPTTLCKLMDSTAPAPPSGLLDADEVDEVQATGGDSSSAENVAGAAAPTDAEQGRSEAPDEAAKADAAAEESDEVGDDPITFGSDEDVERLKRMFGSG
jgi:hypothetical protein